MDAVLKLWPYWGLLLLILGYALLDRRFPDFINNLEENIISIILAVMVIVSFVQVIARYGFNTGWGAALEFTRVMFAWLILFGMSYVMKINAHLGVDAIVRLFPKPVFKILAVVGALTGVIYAMMLLSGEWVNLFGANTKGGAIDYWHRFYRIGLGMEDIAWPTWFSEMFGLKDRVPRWIAYAILPLGLSLFGYRCIQAVWQIIIGEREMIIAAHEAEELVEENRGAAR